MTFSNWLSGFKPRMREVHHYQVLGPLDTYPRKRLYNVAGKLNFYLVYCGDSHDQESFLAQKPSG
jgi:hypothetical protein